MKLLIDLNLSPQWVEFFLSKGIEAVHWSKIGDPRAEDSLIMAQAREQGYVVFTQDVDFSTLLATTRQAGPSVLLLRAENNLPDAVGGDVVQVLIEHSDAIRQGAIVSVDEIRARVRILPLGTSDRK